MDTNIWEQQHIKFMDHILRWSKTNIKRVNVEQRNTENIQCEGEESRAQTNLYWRRDYCLILFEKL